MNSALRTIPYKHYLETSYKQYLTNILQTVHYKQYLINSTSQTVPYKEYLINSTDKQFLTSSIL
jgi:hypothetical protein